MLVIKFVIYRMCYLNKNMKLVGDVSYKEYRMCYLNKNMKLVGDVSYIQKVIFK